MIFILKSQLVLSTGYDPVHLFYQNSRLPLTSK